MLAVNSRKNKQNLTEIRIGKNSSLDNKIIDN